METFELVLLVLAGIGGAAALALSIAVLRAGGERSINRRLAFVLVADAAFQITIVVTNLWSVNYVTEQVPLFFVMLLVSTTYLSFVATLDTPLARRLRSRPTFLSVFVVMCAIVVADLVIIARAARNGLDVEAADPGFPWLLVAVTSLVALGLTISAYRRAARGTQIRRRAGFFALAFGARDILFAAAILGWASFTFLLGRQDIADVFAPILIGIATISFASLLAYGILQSQLFDIDLKIKMGISRGTVASFALAVVFVISKVVEVYASRTLGFVAGGVAAGLLMFAAPRLNKLGDKVANTAMPAVQPTSQYVAYKKLEVYRAAVESALEGDQKIDPAERAMLDRLRVKLGVPEGDALALENELLSPSS